MRRRLTPLLVVAIAASLMMVTVPSGLASDRFEDVPDDNIFHDDISWMAEAEITRGCNPPDNTEFCPDDFVTRGQMAAFFVRALNLTSTEGGTDFTDTDGHLFEGDILRFSAAGITRGCNPPDNDEYCPDDLVTREQMAAFFHRGSRVLIDLQVIQYSDWHGQLDPLFDFEADAEFGGAAALATYFEQERASVANTLTITGGDDFGGTPPLSNVFDERPAVLAQNLMGLDVSTLGNHNFDRGVDHLQEMIDLAEYDYVSANLANVEDNLTGVEPYRIFDFPAGLQVAVIGVTNEEAPSLVFPSSFGTIEVTDSAAAAQSVRDDLADSGVDVFILVAHKGVRSFVDGQAQGELIDLAESVEGFDLVLGDHTDVQYAEMHNGALVTEARSKGRDYARISLQVRPMGSGEVASKSVEFVEPLADAVSPDQAVVDMLEPFREQLADEFDQKIGEAAALFPRGEHGGVQNYERLGEAEVGNLMTDSFLARYDVDFAFTNSGGIRSPLPSSYEPQDETLDRDFNFPDDLVLGDVFEFHSFGNTVVTREITGALLWDMMEHGLGELPDADGRFPQIAGFNVVYDSSQPPGERVVSMETDDGIPILANDTVYTIALPDFVNAGGDDYTMLADGEGTTREPLTTVVAAYIEAQGTITPFLDCRLVDQNPGSVAAQRQPDC